MKLCVECRWMRGNAALTARCGHPKAAHVYRNPVDGSVSERPWNCTLFRVDAPGRCGPDGRLWESKDDPKPIVVHRRVGFVDDDED